jgi:hypothetical protein
MFLDGWVDGWVDGCESRCKDCLRQSKNPKKSFINNRSLCVVSPDDDDLNPINPFQLMIGKTANFLPDPNWKKQAENPKNSQKCGD